jgi:hypothetical protein
MLNEGVVFFRQPVKSFEALLQHSIAREITHKATCQVCKRTGPFESRRTVRASELPPVLAVNACVRGEEDPNLKVWMDGRKTRFLQPRMEVKGLAEEGEGEERVGYEIRVSLTCFFNGSGVCDKGLSGVFSLVGFGRTDRRG